MKHDGVARFVGKKDLNNALWQVRETSLFIDFVMTDYLTFSTELELADSFGKAGFNYYYADLDINEALDAWDGDEYGTVKFRIGKILVPFLSFNENKPNFKQHLMSQPFTAWMFAPVIPTAIKFDGFGWSDYGLTLNWARAFDDAGVLDIKFSLIQGLQSAMVLDSNAVTLNVPTAIKPTVRPRDGLLQNENLSLGDNNSNLAMVGKISFGLFALPIDFGVSLYKGAWDDAGQYDISMYGFHFNYIEPDWTIRGEYARANVEQPPGINPVTATGPATINMSTGNYSMNAWYVEGTVIAFRYGPDKTRYVRAIIRYDEVDSNNKATFTPFDRSRITAGLEWEFLRNIRFRYEWQRSTLHSFDNAPAPYILSGGKEYIRMNMLSVIAYF